MLARVTADAQPGDRRLYLNSTQGIRVGQMYQLLLNDKWALTEGGWAPTEGGRTLGDPGLVLQPLGSARGWILEWECQTLLQSDPVLPSVGPIWAGGVPQVPHLH